eukprot:491112-Pelagomonas_calceolata.AAC.1
MNATKIDTGNRNRFNTGFASLSAIIIIRSNYQPPTEGLDSNLATIPISFDTLLAKCAAPTSAGCSSKP